MPNVGILKEIRENIRNMKAQSFFNTFKLLVYGGIDSFDGVLRAAGVRSQV
jgi:hypothetical protein